MIRDAGRVRRGCPHGLERPSCNETLSRWDNDQVLYLMSSWPRCFRIVTSLLARLAFCGALLSGLVTVVWGDWVEQ